MADNFGVASYAIVLFLLTIWWSQEWGNATACPYTHMEDVVEGKISFRVMALKIWAQLMGGCCVWRFIQFFWWLEISQTHQGKAFEDCSADLQVNFLVFHLSIIISSRLFKIILISGFTTGRCNHRRHCNSTMQISIENFR